MGNSNGNDFAQMNGMAPDGKISMFDVGASDRKFLKVPAVAEIFNSAYEAGARVHTNGWGNVDGIYGQTSYDVDAYLSESEDGLIVFAAGNSGYHVGGAVTSPGNSKNCLSVGAMQLRGVNFDTPLDANSPVAAFSSIGPTADGRVKPDVVAPGDSIVSAYAGSPAHLEVALSPGTSAEGGCAVHGMSGTSMAAAVTAGAALLVRQYFTDSQFWAAVCGDTRNKFCRMGAFEPSGYLMKALLLHSGRRVPYYSNPTTFTRSFNVLESPPDNFQGYGAVTLTNILPLANGKGLQPPLSLYIYDKLKMTAHSTYRSSVTFAGDSELPLKVTIAWFDPPSVVGSSVASLLIHDIDLIVRSPDREVHWGNENYVSCDTHRRGHRDSKNPNEQVLIPHIRCGKSSCAYDVFIRAHSLFARPSQNVALVITSSGTVTDPEATTERFGYDKDAMPSSRHEIQPYISRTVEINTTLKGMFEDSGAFTFPTCRHLHLIKVKLKYNHVGPGPDEAFPSYMEVVLKKTNLGEYYSVEKPVAIGGFGANMSKTAKVTRKWPDEWDVNVNGEYEATIDLTDAEIGGIGEWTMLIRNSFPRSGWVSYDFTATLLFCSAYDTCGPIANVLSDALEVPFGILQDELLSEYNTSYEIPFHNVPLWVRETSPTNDLFKNARKLDRNIETIGVFSCSDCILQTVRIQVYSDRHDNPELQFYGDDFWHLAVVITPPGRRKAVQVGGTHWIGGTDSFYFRRWPDSWRSVYSSDNFSAARDVSAAALTGAYPASPKKKSPPNQESWTVEVALGCSYRKGPMLSFGTVTLFFVNTECSLKNICSKEVVKLNSMAASAPAMNDVRSQEALSLNIQILLGLLCLVLMYCLARASQKTRTIKRRVGLSGKSRPENEHTDYGAFPP